MNFTKADPSYDHVANATNVAKERGCKVVLPGPRELFVDCDSEYSLQQFEKCLGVLQTIEQAIVTRQSPSPSGLPCKKHIVVELNRDLTPLERVLLQACLGSDPAREMLSLRRILRGEQNVTLFFEKEDAIVKASPNEPKLSLADALELLKDGDR